jgi:hypothetical protein
MNSDEPMTLLVYARLHGIPYSTVKGWARDGTLDVDRGVRPMLVKPGQKTPEKDPNIHKWRYQWR